jgi:hypothetical protein
MKAYSRRLLVFGIILLTVGVAWLTYTLTWTQTDVFLFQRFDVWQDKETNESVANCTLVFVKIVETFHSKNVTEYKISVEVIRNENASMVIQYAINHADEVVFHEGMYKIYAPIIVDSYSRLLGKGAVFVVFCSPYFSVAQSSKRIMIQNITWKEGAKP